jgi:Transposase DDE domain group 1
MRSSHSLDRLDTAFDDDRLVADAGLLLPATLAAHLGLKDLVDEHLDLGDRPGRANAGDKLLTLIMSALAGGDCIDDANALRAGGTERVLGFSVKAASTLGTFLRSFRWGHVRQLDAVTRHLLARAWAAGAGPGAEPLTIDLDSTICETYGLAKEGGSRFTHTGVRGYHPLLAVAAGTGDVLMARLRGGNANSGRSAGHFLVETIGRVRAAGARSQLTMRADSGFYAHAVVAVCRKLDVRFSITIRQHRSVRRLIEAIPEAAWTPIPYWLDGGADVAETTYTPFAQEKDAVPVRLIVRRVRPTPGSQLAAFVLYDYHAFITDRDGATLVLEADHRRHAEIENAIRDLKYGMALNHLPSGKFAANGAWLTVQVIAHNLARWTARIGLGEGIVTTKTLRRRLFSLAGRLTRSARRVMLHLPARWPWAVGWATALARLRAIPLLA